MEGLGHGAAGCDLGSMRQILAATKPLELCLRRGAGFMPKARALMASDSPWLAVRSASISLLSHSGRTACWPPQDGQPVRGRRLPRISMRRSLLPKTASGRPLAAEGRTARRASISIVAGMYQLSLCWGPTFDMSGGPKGAKRPLERPLDGNAKGLPTFGQRRRCAKIGGV